MQLTFCVHSFLLSCVFIFLKQNKNSKQSLTFSELNFFYVSCVCESYNKTFLVSKFNCHTLQSITCQRQMVYILCLSIFNEEDTDFTKV